MDATASPPAGRDCAAGDAAMPADARHDLRRRDRVDDALALMRTAGTVSALEYLKSHAVDGRTIVRVLLEPDRRRPQPELAVA